MKKNMCIVIFVCINSCASEIQETISQISQGTELIKNSTCEKTAGEETILKPKQLTLTEFQTLLRTLEMIQKTVDYNCRANSTHDYLRKIRPEMYTVVEDKPTQPDKPALCVIL